MIKVNLLGKEEDMHFCKKILEHYRGVITSLVFMSQLSPGKVT